MSEQLEQLLQQRLPFPGLVAWAVKQEGGACVTRCVAGQLSHEVLKRSLHSLLATADSLREQEIFPGTLAMVFERARLCVAFRKDGCCLALFVQNNSEAKSPAESLLEDFRKM
jgi:hypothetical protein